MGELVEQEMLQESSRRPQKFDFINEASKLHCGEDRRLH